MNILLEDKLLVIWQDNVTRLRWVIGSLTKKDSYEFQYNTDTIQALRNKGFTGLIAFPELNKKYLSKNLFASFVSRLPDKRRSDIKEVLKTYELETYDEFELLKKSGGRLPIDSLEFVEPIDLSKKLIVRQFYIAGVRFNCDKSCSTISSIPINATLEIMSEPENSFDENAVSILYHGNKIGYVPSYFSKELTKAINNRNIILKIVRINARYQFSKNCHECIKVQLTIE